MDFSLIWQAGQVACVLGLLYGAYLAVMETHRRSTRRFSGSGALSRLPSGKVVMDSQHQALRDQIKGLQVAIRSEEPRDQLGGRFDTFLLDVAHHFRSEEAVHESAGYLEAAKHAALHSEVLRSSATLMARFRKRESDTGEVFRFLAYDMLAKHESGADHDFVLSLERRS